MKRGYKERGFTHVRSRTQRERSTDEQTNGNGTVEGGDMVRKKITAIPKKTQFKDKTQTTRLVGADNECGVNECDFCKWEMNEDGQG